MRTIKLLFILFTCFAIAFTVSAQKVKTESFKVAGECNMCKKKIETAAKQAGATYASWNPKTKLLRVTYNVTGGGVAAIQHSIAQTGYDTPAYKATEEAYNSLDACCQYERGAKVAKCCDQEKCTGDREQLKDGKCAESPACKGMDCCKKS